MKSQEKLIKKIFISIALIIITIITFKMSVYLQTKANLLYKEQSSLDYKVYLKDNNYFQTQHLGKEMQYIASLVDHIYIDFNYDFKINENIDYDYKYYIEADLTIFEKNKPNNIIFEKKEKLVENIAKNDTNLNEININENLKINYDQYNNLVKEFKSEYNISADSNMKIALYIEVNGIYKKFEYSIKKNNKMEILIPLNEQIINISTNYNDSSDGDELIRTSDRGVISNTLLFISILFGVLSIMSIIKLLIFINKSRSKKSLYQKKKEKILRNYDRVIAELKDMIHIQNEEKVIEITSFEELLDISDRLCKPILFIEVEKDKKSCFMVKNDEEIYSYILEEVNLENVE